MKLSERIENAKAVGRREFPGREISVCFYMGEILLEIWREGGADLYLVTGEVL